MTSALLKKERMLSRAERRRQQRNAAARRYRAAHRDAIKVAENLEVPIAVARALLGITQQPHQPR